MVRCGRKALMLAAVSTFYIYFGKANARFTAGSVPPDRLPVELERWATWHWWRTGLSFLALTAAMVALWHT
jgi:hypothetical protein